MSATMTRDIDRLTVEQAERLTAWVSHQNGYIHSSMRLDVVLKLFHASRNYDTLQDWFDARGRWARLRYNEIVGDRFGLILNDQ